MVAGTVALDMIPQFPPATCRRDEILMEGKTVYIPDIRFILGGCVSNTGIAMHRLGAETILCSKVGDDPLAGVVRRLLEESGAAVQLKELKGHASSATIVATAPSGTGAARRRFMRCRIFRQMWQKAVICFTSVIPPE